MPNIEIKARYHDLDQARRIATKLNAQYMGQIHQIDTYFQTKMGMLKLRESDVNGSELIPYIKVNHANTKRSDYARLPTDNPDLVKDLLGQLLGVKLVVDKLRDVYLIDNVRVHLDQVKGLGTFFEFEAVFTEDTEEVQQGERQKLQELMKAFDIAPSDLLEGSYPDLLSQTLAKTVATESHQGRVAPA